MNVRLLGRGGIVLKWFICYYYLYRIFFFLLADVVLAFFVFGHLPRGDSPTNNLLLQLTCICILKLFLVDQSLLLGWNTTTTTIVVEVPGTFSKRSLIRELAFRDIWRMLQLVLWLVKFTLLCGDASVGARSLVALRQIVDSFGNSLYRWAFCTLRWRFVSKLCVNVVYGEFGAVRCWRTVCLCLHIFPIKFFIADHLSAFKAELGPESALIHLKAFFCIFDRAHLGRSFLYVFLDLVIVFVWFWDGNALFGRRSIVLGQADIWLVLEFVNLMALKAVAMTTAQAVFSV